MQNCSVAPLGRSSLPNNRYKTKHTPLRSVLPFCFSAFRSIDFCCFATDCFPFDYLNVPYLVHFLRFGGFFVDNVW